jgi:hypothetical protein
MISDHLHSFFLQFANHLSLIKHWIFHDLGLRLPGFIDLYNHIAYNTCENF